MPRPVRHAQHRIGGCACHHKPSKASWNLHTTVWFKARSFCHCAHDAICRSSCAAWYAAQRCPAKSGSLTGAHCLIGISSMVPGVKVSDLTGLKWPSSKCRNLPDETSNTATVPSWLPQASHCPSGLNAMLRTNLSFLNFSSPCICISDGRGGAAVQHNMHAIISIAATYRW